MDILGLSKDLADRMELRVVSKAAFYKKDGSLPKPDPAFLSSLIAPDIRRVRDAIAKRDAGRALTSYLSWPLPGDARTDLGTTGTRCCTACARTRSRPPAGRRRPTGR